MATMASPGLLSLLVDPVDGHEPLLSQQATDCHQLAASYHQFVHDAASRWDPTTDTHGQPDAATGSTASDPTCLSLTFGNATDARSLKRATAVCSQQEPDSDDLAAVSANVQVAYYPQYGAAILRHSAIGSSAGLMVHFAVVGLDEWRFGVHGISGPQRQHVACADAHRLVQIGTRPRDQADEVTTRFNKLLKKAQQRTDEQRHAMAGSHRGHQRTPAFLVSLVEDALTGNTGNETDPRGAFTDVGQHTGGQPRCTIQPLVSACIHEVLRLQPYEEDDPLAECTAAELLHGRAQALFVLHLQKRASWTPTCKGQPQIGIPWCACWKWPTS